MATDDLSDRSARKRIRARHTKSRKGCSTCKGRRVKCDEIKPTCGACALRGELCDWPAETGSQRHDTPDQLQADGSRTSRAISKSAQDRSQRSSAAAAARLDSGSPRPLHFDLRHAAGGSPTHPLNMVDLQLHSHFMLHTCKHMSLNPRRQRIWETVLPQFAMRNEALMHLLLALAGLDFYASDRTAPPDRTSDHDLDAAYLEIIIEHHQCGLKAFREDLGNLPRANRHHVFAGSMLLVAFALASLRIRNLTDTPQLAQPRLDWIYLIQGLCSVVKQNWPELRTGPLRDMTQFDYANDDWRMYPREALRCVDVARIRLCSPRLVAFCHGTYDALAQLVAYHESLGSRSHPEAPRSPILAEQKAALEILEQMYMRTLYVVRFSDEGRQTPLDVQADLEDAALMSWPEFLPAGFLATLDGGGGCSALSYVILAYFHLLFSLLEGFWFIKGGFDGEIVKIQSLVDSSAETGLVALMQWPVSVIAVQSDS